MPEVPSNLRADTVLTPDSSLAGRFHADIPEGWKVVHVFGGVTMYTALRAMQEALGRPDLTLVTANAIFLAPVPPGPVTIDVEVLRDGRTASQVAADLRVDGKLALRAHGVFGIAHDTEIGFLDVQFPDVPAPLDLEIPEPPPGFDRGPFEHINFHDQTDWRPVDGFAPWDPDFKAGPARMKVWTRLHCEPQLPDGSYDPLALAVHGDVIGPAVGQGLGPIETPFMVLSLEIGIRFVATPVTPWVLQEIEAWHVGDGYATGPARLWDEEGNLCAIATQTATLRLFPTEQRAEPA
jgi:acyl-CoA thioesterase